LQKEIKESDLELFKNTPQIRFYGEHLTDFSETAALMMNLDLIVSTCTSIPHLSAALGKPTWLLLAYTPDWRWLLNRKDTPWYPTMLLFRQERAGDWYGVINHVKKELKSYFHA
jgi:ADP-heptose:LPS heptosyltransferase